MHPFIVFSPQAFRGLAWGLRVVDGNPPTDFASGYALWFDNNGDAESAPYLNPNFGAGGDDSLPGNIVTANFTDFTTPLGFTGDSTDLVITFDLDGNGENFAIDSFELVGTPVPEPAAFGTIGAAVVLLLGFRRRG